MSDNVHRTGSGTSKERSHQHKGKSSERFVNKEIILKALNIHPGQTIRDAGCGNGYMAKIFSKQVTHSGKVYALDSDEETIEVLRKETEGTNIETMVGDITKPTRPMNHLWTLSTYRQCFTAFQKIPCNTYLMKPNAFLSQRQCWQF